MEDVLPALQHQVNAPQNQNAALESSVARAVDDCARPAGIAWGNHDGVQPCTSTDEQSACRPQTLGRAACVLRQGGRLRVGQESRERCGFVSRSDVPGCHCSSGALGVLDLDDETSAEMDGQLFGVLSALADGESVDVVTSAGGARGFESWRKLHRSRARSRQDVHEVL